MHKQDQTVFKDDNLESAIGNHEKLFVLRDCLQSNIELPGTLKQWLIDALNRLALGESLSKAFGIHDTITEHKQRRDVMLREYADTLSGSYWCRAGDIAKEISRLRQRRKCCPILASIDRINALPETQRQIFAILKK